MQRPNPNKRILDRLTIVSEIRSRNRIVFRSSLMEAAMNPGPLRLLPYPPQNETTTPYQEGPSAA